MQVSPESVELVAHMTEEMGPRLSRNEIRMIKSMAKKETGENLSGKDVRIVSEIVKAMGGDDGLRYALTMVLIENFLSKKDFFVANTRENEKLDKW